MFHSTQDRPRAGRAFRYVVLRPVCPAILLPGKEGGGGGDDPSRRPSPDIFVYSLTRPRLPLPPEIINGQNWTLMNVNVIVHLEIG